MSSHQSNLPSLPVATSNLPFPIATASVPLIEMAPEIAEKTVRNAIERMFLSAPGTVKELKLLGHIELRLAKVAKGVDIEINDTGTIVQLWRKNDVNQKWGSAWPDCCDARCQA